MEENSLRDGLYSSEAALSRRYSQVPHQRALTKHSGAWHIIGHKHQSQASTGQQREGSRVPQRETESNNAPLPGSIVNSRRWVKAERGRKEAQGLLLTPGPRKEEVYAFYLTGPGV